MSLTLGSLSSGSIGPSPVISSRISLTKPASSWALSASRSTRMYCETSCWTCLRISSSGSFSSAERLISSISLRCSRTLASSSLSVSSGFGAGAAACAGCAEGCGASISGTIGSGSGSPCGNTVHATASSAGGGGGATAAGIASGAVAAGENSGVARRVLNRPAMTIGPAHPLLRRCAAPLFDPLSSLNALRTRPGQRHFLVRRRGRPVGRRRDQLLELRGDLVARLDLVERNAAVDRLAHQRVVVWNGGDEILAERLLDVALAQAGAEHALLEAIDDDARPLAGWATRSPRGRSRDRRSSPRAAGDRAAPDAARSP